MGVRGLLGPMVLLVMFMAWELLDTLDMLPAMLVEPSMAILLFTMARGLLMLMHITVLMAMALPMVTGVDMSMGKGQLNQQLIPTMVAMDMPMVYLVGILMCPDLLLTDTDVKTTLERAVMSCE